MTYGARLFLITLAFHFLTANLISLEHPIIPKIDCNDLNDNGNPDFIAFNNSLAPRTLYHIEYKDSGIDILWEYSMPDKISGYFVHMLLDDFDNDGQLELIVAAYQEGKQKIFYVFPVDGIGFNENLIKVMNISNYSSIINPEKLYSLNTKSDGERLFVLTQASPSRHIIICKYMDNEINSIGSYGKKILPKTMGPLALSFGNFDKDSIEDIFFLSNGQNPEGYFIFSDGLEQPANISNYPRIRLLYNRGVDLNFDGTDDLLMVDRHGGLRSNIWGTESIELSDSNIQNILVNLDEGLIHLKSISNSGKIGKYIIDPLTREILTSEYNIPGFTEEGHDTVYSLLTTNYVFLINNLKISELWSLPIALEHLTALPLAAHLQKIYPHKPDYVINTNELFIHTIQQDTTKAFLHFTGEYLPIGMEFSLDDIQLEWTPAISQLGFHEFSYVLELRERGDLEKEIANDMQLVIQKENILEEKHSYLIYVNDPVLFNNKEKHITFVNSKPSEWIIPINDNNIDALLVVEKINGYKTAEFQLLQPIPKEELLETSNWEDTQLKDISNAQINIHRSKFYWTPNTDQDNFQFSLRVSDGYSADTLSFIVTIHPEIDLNMNQTEFNATVNKTVNIPVKLKQTPPSESYTYELINAPENMWVTENGAINWIPMTTDVDDNLFKIKVSDGIATSELQYTIYVNSVPVISSRPSEPFIINLGDSLFFPLDNFDMNQNAKLTWKLLSGPSNMIVNSEGVLIWGSKQLDYHPYEIQLSDGIDSIKWTGSIYVNVPPTITSTPITFIEENELYEYPIEAQDDNKMNPLNPFADAKIEFDLIQGPIGMEIDYQNILRWKPANNVSGEFSVFITASDGIEITPQKFQLLVNSFPVIISMDSFSVKIGDTLNCHVKASDQNPADSLSYFIDEIRPGMTFDNNNGLLTWIPSEFDIGQQYFNLNVKDGPDSPGTDQELQIFVYDLPIFTGDLAIEAFVGLEYKAFLTAENMYGKKMKHTGAIIIETTTIKNYTLSEPYGRYFLWTPNKKNIGKHKINMRITDEYGFTRLHTHTISVFKNPCFQCDGDPGGSPVDTTGN